MCCPGCHHLPAKLPGTSGKVLVHANYSLLWMGLEHVFQLDPLFPFRTLQLCKMVQLEDWGSKVYLTGLLTLCSHISLHFVQQLSPAFSTDQVVAD